MSVANDVIGIIFAVLLILVNIPQYWKIISHHTSLGFSPWFFMLGNIASFWVLLVTGIFYINSIWTCRGVGECAESFIGFGLVVEQWILYMLLYLLYLWYLPRGTEPYWERFPGMSRRLVCRLSFIVSNIVSFGGLVGVLLILNKHKWRNPDVLSDVTAYISFMESVVTICFLTHYLPQIWEIYKLRDPGSLSLITLTLTSLGSFLWGIFLSIQGNFVLTNGQVSSPHVWLPYIAVGIMQLIILVMCVYYDRRKMMIARDLSDEERIILEEGGMIALEEVRDIE